MSGASTGLVAERIAGALGAEHEAGADEAAIKDHRAGATIARAAAFFAACQPQLVAQAIQQRFAWIGQKINRIAVDHGRDMDLAHLASPLARA